MYTVHMSRRAFTRFAMVVVLALVLALAFGGILHSLVPHNHGVHSAHEAHPSGHEEESPVWKALHASLHHEEKNLIYALLALFSLAFVVTTRAHFLVRVSTRARGSVRLRRYTVPRTFISGRWLTRGISPYRRFL